MFNNKLISTVIFVTALPAALVAAGSRAAEIWKIYNDGRFIVQFPGTPTVSHSTAGSEFGTVPSSSVALNSGAEFFQVGYTDYPAPRLSASQTPPDGRLNAMLTESMAHIDGTILHSHKISLNGAPGREIVAKLQSANGPQILQDRDYLVGSRLYEVGVMAPYSESNSPRILRFLNSFKIVQTRP